LLYYPGEEGVSDDHFERGETAKGEPESCPYPVEDPEDSDNGKSHRTSTTDGDGVDEFDEVKKIKRRV
jgi:hypothetical protein